jgi:hypothetical protein
MNSSKATPDPRQFTKLFDELLRSDAWRTLSINGRRFLDFLMIEHHAKGGKENGLLKAPYEQLEAFGVGARYLADAIREAEELGLVECHRGGMRVATMYGLTWLPTHNGAPATDGWRNYHSSDLKPLPSPKPKNLPAKGKAALPAKGKADRLKPPQSARKREGRSAKNLPAKGKVLSRRSYQGGSNGKEGEGEHLQEPVRVEPAEVRGDPAGKPEAPARQCGWYVTDPNGFRICGKPAVDEGERCAEHAHARTAPGKNSVSVSGRPNPVI